MAPGACSTQCTWQMGSDMSVQRAGCKTAESLHLCTCLCTSLRQKGSCKHIILLHSHVKLSHTSCTVVTPAVLPKAAATNVPCQEFFCHPSNLLLQWGIEPSCRVDGSWSVKSLKRFGQAGCQFVRYLNSVWRGKWAARGWDVGGMLASLIHFERVTARRQTQLFGCCWVV